MTSKQEPEAESRGADTPQDGNPSEDELVDVRGPDNGGEDGRRNGPRDISAHERNKSPAFVAPIPKIPIIPPLTSADIHVPPETRPKLPEFVGSFLRGKKVDEFGDIIDERTGQVLARVAGDLPSIAGRTVSNREGDILGDDGQLLGYVADIGVERKPVQSGNSSPETSKTQQTRRLDEYVGRNMAAFRVDHLGNILDSGGSIVGRFHDNNNPLHRHIREEEEKGEHKREKQDRDRKEQDEEMAGEKGPAKRENAASYRKEDDSPSDIFLDVKSTRDGIQLTIRIPTVFNGQQARPHVQFS